MAHPEVRLDRPESLRAYLASFDLFAGKEAEGIGYVNLALRRFLITLDLLPPAPEPGARLLELGANPYFLTLLIKRFHAYSLTLANYFTDSAPAQGIQVLTSQQYGERHEFVYDHFNGEVARFPYADHTFDVVLNCEILEHLVADPTHYLCECHRVLKPGGFLLLTTPNVLAWQNLWRLATQRNVYDLYSGYGVYGRHNREYTPAEVIELLQGCGFTIARLRLEDIYPHRGVTRWLKRLRHHWRDNLFVLAQASGRPCYYYPNWLYRSREHIRRIIHPEVVMGENDAVQLGEGWYPLERLPFAARWTSAQAVAYLLLPSAPRRLGLEVNAQGATLGPTTLTIAVAEMRRSVVLAMDHWQGLAFDLPDGLPPEVEVRLFAEPTRNPARLGLSRDDRDLGVLVRRIWIEEET